MCRTALPLGLVRHREGDRFRRGRLRAEALRLDRDAARRGRLRRDPELADVGERVDRFATLAERRGDELGGHVGDAGPDAGGHVARLLFRKRIGAAAAAAAERGERLELRQRRLRVDHPVVDGAAAVAVHLQDRRHLKAGTGRERGDTGGEPRGGAEQQVAWLQDDTDPASHRPEFGVAGREGSTIGRDDPRQATGPSAIIRARPPDTWPAPRFPPRRAKRCFCLSSTSSSG